MGEKKMKKYVSLVELTQIIPFSKNTIKKYIEDEGLPALKVDKKLIFNIDEVEIWLKRFKV